MKLMLPWLQPIFDRVFFEGFLLLMYKISLSYRNFHAILSFSCFLFDYFWFNFGGFVL